MTGAADRRPAPDAGSPGDPYAGVPARPQVIVVLRDDGSGTVNGQRIDIPPGADRHAVLMTEACRIAATLGRPVRVVAGDARTEWRLIAFPDGGVTPVDDGRPREVSHKPHPVDKPVDKPVDESLPAPPRISPPVRARSAFPAVPPVAAASPAPPPVAAAPPVRVARRAGPGLVPGEHAGDRGGTGGAVGAAGTGTGRRAPARPGAVVWSTSSPRRLRPPGLPLLGGLVIGGLVLASIAVMTLPGGPSVTGAQVVTTVTADPAGTPSTIPSPSGSAAAPAAAGSSPAAGSSKAVPPSVARPLSVASLSVAGPPGFAARPAWTLPIAAWSRSVASDGGTVLSRDPEGRILLLDPSGGQVRWRSDTVTGPTQDGPWLTRIDGVPAAAVVGDGVLSYWSLPPAGTGAGVGVRVPAGATVSWIGGSPLVVVPGGAGVIQGRSYHPVTLPTGARALAADGATVLAVVGSTFVQQPAGRPAATPRPLPRPAGAGPRPLRVEAVGTTYLFVVWPRAGGGGQLVGLVDTGSGQLVVQTALPAATDLTRGGVVREIGGTQTLVGSVLVDTYTSNLNLLDPRYAVKTITRGHAWAVFEGRSTDIHLTRDGDFTTVPFPAGEAAVPIGTVAPAGSRTRVMAVVVAPSRGGWILCGLPAVS